MISGLGKRFYYKLIVCISIATAATIISFVLFFYNAFDRFESRTWDIRVRALADPSKADQDIKIITVDQTSISYFAEQAGIEWPWPRELYGLVLKFLRRTSPKAVGIDLLFTESSAADLVEQDRKFAQDILGNLPVVLNVELNNNQSIQDRELLERFMQKQFSKDRESGFSEFLKRIPKIDSQRYTSIRLPVLELLETAMAFGNVKAEPDKDGVFRHFRPGGYANNIPVLSLPFALFDIVYPGRLKDEHSLLSSIQPDGRLAINFHGGEHSYQTYRIASVLKSEYALAQGDRAELSPDIFKNSWVFIGVTAPALHDQWPTPVSAIFPGVEYNAVVLDNLLHGDFVRRLQPIQGIAITFIFSLLLSAASIFVKRISKLSFLVFLVFVLFILLSYLAAAVNIWLPVFVPMLLMTFTLIASLTFQYFFEGREHRFIKSAFNQYVSTAVIQQIIEQPDRLALGGERRELSIFFSDVAGFTSISETLEPDRLVTMLNTYLSAMTDIILDHQGTLDKYEGDAIICFWNAPLDVPTHQTLAVEAAISCQVKLEQLKQDFLQEYGVELVTRIGINTGEVVVGNFGSSKRFDYTVIGDAANLASRLEGVNKVFGTRILISDNTKQGLSNNIRVRKVAEVQVVGRGRSLTVWEPLVHINNQLLDIYEQARVAFEIGDVKKSLQLFKSIQDSDPVSLSYVKRIESFEDEQYSQDWFPVWVLKDK